MGLLGGDILLVGGDRGLFGGDVGLGGRCGCFRSLDVVVEDCS